MLCQICKREPAYWQAELRVSETGQTVVLCDGCYRQQKTVEGTVRTGKRLDVSGEPTPWGVR